MLQYCLNITPESPSFDLLTDLAPLSFDVLASIVVCWFFQVQHQIEWNHQKVFLLLPGQLRHFALQLKPPGRLFSMPPRFVSPPGFSTTPASLFCTRQVESEILAP